MSLSATMFMYKFIQSILIFDFEENVNKLN